MTFGRSLSSLSKESVLEHEVVDQGEEALKHIREALSADPDHDGKPCTFVESRGFRIFVNSLTFLNVIQMGFQADYPDWKGTWVITENIFTAGFSFELFSKLCTFRCKYFHDAANCLDGFLTVLGILDVWIMAIMSSAGNVHLQSFTVLRVLRIFRLVRMMKLVRSVKPLVLVLRGVMNAMSSAFYVSLVCLCLFYVVAIFLTEHLGKASNSNMYPGFSTDLEDINQLEFLENYNPYVCWGSMLSSMLTLFNITTGAEWADIVRPIYIKQPEYVPVLVFFAIIVGFSVMNVLIGVIVDCVNEEARHMETSFTAEINKQKLQILKTIESMLKELDEDGDGTINAKELRHAMTCNDTLRDLMARLDLPLGWSAEELLDLLDSNGLGKLSYGNFTTSLFRMIGCNDFQHLCMMERNINEVKQILSYQHERTQAKVLATAADVASIKKALGIDADSQEILFCTDSSKTTSSSNVERSSGPERLRGQKATTSHGIPCSRPSEQHPTAEACVGVVSTSEGFQKPKAFDLAPYTHLAEALSAALKAVHECIQEDLKNLNAQNQIYSTQVVPVIGMQSQADVVATTRSGAIGDPPSSIQADAVALTECSMAKSRHSELLTLPTVVPDGVRNNNELPVHQTLSLENMSPHGKSESDISLRLSEICLSL